MSYPLAVIVAGPTCSGKSALALALAEQLDGVVINADAMQVYRDLRILTARPSPEHESRVPHALYGVRPATEPGTAAWWRSEALRVMTAAAPRVPILCGGTGMYLNALLQNLSDIPDPGPKAREEARALLAQLGAGGLHARLLAADPATAARLRPTDGQRVARAWEVWRGTGRGLAAWHAERPAAVLPWRVRAVLVQPERQTLHGPIAERWQAMLNSGAVEEVRALRSLGLDPAVPAMRAHGVPELCAWLDGTIELPEASRRAILAIGQYTKRQTTWLRHHTLANSEDTFTIAARISDATQVSTQNMAAMTSFLSQHD